MAVTGLKEVLTNLSTEIRKIEGRTAAGLHEAGIFVQGESMEITPQKTGVLNNSAFTNQPEIKNTGPSVTVGYTATYAPFVHEMPTTFNYTKPGTGPKFLQKAVANNQPMILSIIQKRAKVP
jgi:hypothetical protein